MMCTFLKERLVLPMANNKELMEYIMEQLLELGDVRNISMIGGEMFAELPERKPKKRLRDKLEEK